MSITLLSCSKFSGNSPQYGFVQGKGEALESFVVRAACEIMDTGLNRIAHYKGTNHVAANNAAFSIPKDTLSKLKASRDAIVVAASELVDARQGSIHIEGSMAKLRKSYGRYENLMQADMPGGQVQDYGSTDVVKSFLKGPGASVHVATDGSADERHKVGASIQSLVSEFERGISFMNTQTPEGRRIANAYMLSVAHGLSEMASVNAFKDFASLETMAREKVDARASEFALARSSKHASWTPEKHNRYSPK